jgi:hypothetical protein
VRVGARRSPASTVDTEVIMDESIENDNVDVPTSLHNPNLSREAIAAIEERAAVSRPAVLAELAKVVWSRKRDMTPQELAAVAAFVQLTYPGGESALESWARKEVGTELFSSEIEIAMLAGHGRLIGQRQLREVFQITDDEADEHGLDRLVSDAVRMRRSRASERLPLPAEGKTVKPWVSLGIPQSTYYAQKKAAPLRAIKEELAKSGLRYPGPEVAGVSKSTWYRQQRADEIRDTKTCKNRVPREDAYFLSYYRNTEIPSFRVTADPIIEDFPIAECRRFAVLALRQGRKWIKPFTPALPYDWFEVPEGLKLSESENQEYYIAARAARNAQDREEYRRRKRERMESDAWEAQQKANPKPLEPFKPRDPQSKPGRVSQEIWDKVPPCIRPFIFSHTARKFMAHRHNVDECVIASIEPATRSAVLHEAIKSRLGDVTYTELYQNVREHWQRPTADALELSLIDIEKAREKRKENKVTESKYNLISEIWKIIDNSTSPVPTDDRELIAAAALAHLKTWFDGTPKLAVEYALASEPWTWNHMLSESWYREFTRINPETGAKHAKARRDHDADVQRDRAAEAPGADDSDQAGDTGGPETEADPTPVLNLKQFSVAKHDRTAIELADRSDPEGSAKRYKAMLRAHILKEAGLDEWEPSAAARQ